MHRALLLALAIPLQLIAADRPAKPNVILLLTDDLGWQDVKCYDIDEPSPMDTPNIDALAKKGVMFWQAYSPTPVCSSSRCAIMSGNHPVRAQKTSILGGVPPAPRAKNVRMIDPWYSGRMPADEFTLARALGQSGYATGHVGKWHIAINHKAFPQPEDVGFDFTRSDRGSRNRMKPDRLNDFATTDKDDPYRLDENGYPFHQTNEDAITFMRDNKDKPFFLYYATWLVHSPIHTRSKAHLEKYAKRLGIDPTKVPTRDTPGQINPYYCAMVQELDYYVGQIFNYLDETDDPRWPGHKLSENTYIIFTSDNGGMEGGPTERYTDNFPLDRGKISAMEGGTRVPLIITGPGISKGVQTNVMANGLDFYPTVLSMTGTQKPTTKNLDGCDLYPLLTKNPTDPSLVKTSTGNPRDTMVWHFPHGAAMESTIRVGDYKLIRNYDHVGAPETPELELYRLYETIEGKQKRVDVEESKNLVEAQPKKATELNSRLTKILTGMKARYPYYNATRQIPLPHQKEIPTVKGHQQKGRQVTFTFQKNGAKVVRADLIYTLNGGKRYEEWFCADATISGNKVTATIPKKATHYFLNLIDENQFLVSYPFAKRIKDYFAPSALKVK